MSDGVDRQFGYLHGQDRPEEIDEFGLDPDQVLMSAREAFPGFNPYAAPFVGLQYQGNQGACQGHALAHAFQVAAVQKYSMQAKFSRACGYYRAQKFDGINGDRGSTLAGGQKVANSGMCLEKDWPYPSRYNPRQPDGIELAFTMPGSRQIKDADQAWELLRAGCMIQTGVKWTSGFEREICDQYRGGGGGGHSTLLYGLVEGSDNAWHHNSWRGWMGDGRNQWTKNFFAQILRNDSWSVFVCYDSTSLVVPESFFSQG